MAALINVGLKRFRAVDSMTCGSKPIYIYIYIQYVQYIYIYMCTCVYIYIYIYVQAARYNQNCLSISVQGTIDRDFIV